MCDKHTSETSVNLPKGRRAGPLIRAPTCRGGYNKPIKWFSVQLHQMDAVFLSFRSVFPLV